jgi:hypothetical protein
VTIRHNTFGRGAVTPSDYVNLGVNGNGHMHNNAIASATNASADIIIPAGLIYTANYTEAGVTTARPA